MPPNHSVIKVWRHQFLIKECLIQNDIEQLIHHERSVSVTSFFKSSAAPAFTSSKVASVLPHLPVSISAVVPHCVVTDIVQ